MFSEYSSVTAALTTPEHNFSAEDAEIHRELRDEIGAIASPKELPEPLILITGSQEVMHTCVTAQTVIAPVSKVLIVAQVSGL